MNETMLQTFVILLALFKKVVHLLL